MAPLNKQQLLQEKQTRDPLTITNLGLNGRGLTEISCLVEFKKLERLDLGFNIISSIEGLSACASLKWLSISQNKLYSLKGIEGLKNLLVLNAAKNNLTAINEVMSLTSLRALILNDNEISSVCKLDHLKDLNTLVLSRNPLRKMGDFLDKVKSITKLSLSNCQLESIGSSFKSLVYLKEVKLAHNEITVLPAQLACNVKLQNLDLGNNCISRSSELSVLSSLQYLKSLNLQGNPIAEKSTLPKKIIKLVPNLQIFNNKPIGRIQGNEQTKTTHANDTAVTVKVKGENISRKRSSSHNKDSPIDAEVLNVEREMERKRSKPNKSSNKDVSYGIHLLENDGEDKLYHVDDIRTPNMQHTPHIMMDTEDNIRKKKNKEYAKGKEDTKDKKDTKDKISCGQVAVVLHTKKKKADRRRSAHLPIFSSTEVGSGGPSAWDA